MEHASIRRMANNAGGARVLVPNIMVAGRKRMAGECLTEEEFNSIGRANRDALIRNGMIMPWPKDVDAPLSGERYLVRREDGKFDVVQGSIVNPAPLDTEAAANKWLNNTKPTPRLRAADLPPRVRDTAKA